MKIKKNKMSQAFRQIDCIFRLHLILGANNFFQTGKIKNLSFHFLGAIFGVRRWAKKLFATFILTLPIVVICELLKFLPKSKEKNSTSN